MIVLASMGKNLSFHFYDLLKMHFEIISDSVHGISKIAQTEMSSEYCLVFYVHKPTFTWLILNGCESHNSFKKKIQKRKHIWELSDLNAKHLPRFEIRCFGVQHWFQFWNLHLILLLWLKVLTSSC